MAEKSVKVKVEEVTTKAGTKVYVVGNLNTSDHLLESIGRPFKRYYDKDFTKQEQKQIGNIFYDVFLNKHTHSQVSLEKRNKTGGTVSYFKGEDAEYFNPGGKGSMIEVSFGKNHRNNESFITHELIHAKEYINKKPINKMVTSTNEKKVDFETVGRVTKRGIDTFDGGYYYRNPTKKERDKIIKKYGRNKTANEKWEDFIHQNIIKDRILLTGSVKKQIIGKRAETKVKKTFKKSTIFTKTKY
jgi:hypothetical protein